MLFNLTLQCSAYFPKYKIGRNAKQCLTLNTWTNDNFNRNFCLPDNGDKREKIYIEQVRETVEWRHVEIRHREDATRDAQSVTDRARFNVAGFLLSRVPGEVGKNRSRTPTRLEAKHHGDTMMLRIHSRNATGLVCLDERSTHVCSADRTTFSLSESRGVHTTKSFYPRRSGMHPISERLPENLTERERTKWLFFCFSSRFPS